MENLLFLGVPILKHIRVFPFQKEPKNVGLPYKMDLFIRQILNFWLLSGGKKQQKQHLMMKEI